MNEQDLKNSILQLAIQGKLVEQREEEGTAKELLEQIRAEKEQLIEEKKIKKEKPLEEISEDEIPFDIPESWQWTNLAELTTINGGFAFKSANYSQHGVRVIRISDFNEQGFVNNKIVRHMYDDSLEMYLLEKNDILLCMTGGTVGKSYFVKEINEPMMSNQRVATIKINHRILPDYINYTILSPVVQSLIRSSKNSTNDNISMDTIKRFTIPLPPLEEQKRIVTKIEELMTYAEKYGEAYSKVEALNKNFPKDMEKSILQYAIQGKLVEQREKEGTAEELYKQIQAEKEKLIKEGKIKKEKPLSKITDSEIPFDIPDNWKWVKLLDVCKIIHYGYTASACEVGNCKLLRITDIQDNSVEWDLVPFCTIKESEYITHGLNNRDIMIARTGGTIGKTYIVKSLKERAVFASYLIRAVPVENINEAYLKRYMESPLYWMQLKSNSMGTGQPNVNATALKNLILPLPPIGEQVRIVSELENILLYAKQLVK